ncbi:hypothetical protein [Mycobacterium sp. URHB0021]|jgi:hypothetical protein
MGTASPVAMTYLAYLVDTMPKLAGYAMAVHRVTYVSEALAFAELAETVELDGKPMLTDEVLVFGFDDDGRITRVDILVQTPRPLPSPP